MHNQNELHTEKEIKRILQQEVEIPEPVANRIEETLAYITQTSAQSRKTAGSKTQTPVSAAHFANSNRKQQPQTTTANSNHKRHRKGSIGKKRHFGAAAAAAAVLACTSITAVAAVVFHWNNMVVEKFEIDEVQQETLVEQGIAPVVNASATENGVTVSTEQALMDSKFIYLLLKIEAPEDVTLSEYVLFEDFNLTLDGSDADFSYSSGLMDEDTSDNISYWAVWINNSISNYDFHGKTLGIHLKNLLDDVQGANPGTKLIDGRWDLEWNMVYEDSETVFELERQVPELDMTIKRIVLSPISIEVIYDWKRQQVADQGIDENGNAFDYYYDKEPPVMTSFRMKDGSIQAIDLSGPGNIGYLDENSTEYRTSYGMGRIVTVDDVAGILFLDPESGTEAEITLKQ